MAGERRHAAQILPQGVAARWDPETDGVSGATDEPLRLQAPLTAGPNEGGTLVVHDTGLAYSGDPGPYPTAAPACAEIDAEGPANAPFLWKVYAAFPLASSVRTS